MISKRASGRTLGSLRRLAVVLVAGALTVSLFPAAAAAHSFLINSQPQAGARLAKAPQTMTLYFSEAFVPGSQRVSLRRAGGATIELTPAQGRGAEIDQPLPAHLRGIFIVSWRVLSDDGHVSLGEFAFAAGSAGVLPAISSSSSQASWPEVGASWLLFLGLALALGGLLSERFVWRRTPAQKTVAAAPVAFGVALAGLGALLELVLLAENQRAGGFASALHAGALGDALTTRPGKLTLALLVSVVVSGVLVPLRRLRVAAILPLLAATLFTAARGHSGTSHYGWAVAADFVHLTAVAAWLGALAHLVFIIARADEPRSTLVDGVRRYSRFALPTVLFIMVTGVLTAIPEFRSVGAVFTSGYGQTLLVKSALIAVALLIALVARQRALPANPQPRLPLLRRLTLGEATTLATVLVVAAVLANAAPPRTPAAASAASTVLGPPPVAGPAVRLADLAGQFVLGLTAGQRELQFTIVPPGTQQPGKLKLTVEARHPDGTSVDLYPRPCGSTCFSIRFPLRRGVTRVTAEVSSSAWQGGRVRFAIPWPLPPEQPGLVSRVAKAMSEVRTLQLTEAVTSGIGSGAPLASYSLSGRQFMQTEVFGGGAVDVRPLGRRGRLTEVAFAIPGSSIWYRIWIDHRYRLQRELILDPGHRIYRTFNYNPGARARGATSSASSSVSPTGASVTPPPQGSIVFGQEDNELAVGLAVRPGRTVVLQATVLGPDGGGLSGLDVGFHLQTPAGTNDAKAKTCGSGCYRATITARGRPVAVTLSISGAGPLPRSALLFTLPTAWPPPPATKLLAAATHAFRELKTLVTHERLASSPTNVVNTTYEAVAPDRFAYQIAGGSQAIVIGNRRWDRNGGGLWRRSPQSPLRQPTPFWSTAANAHLLGSMRIDGRPAWLISFYDTQISAFFAIAVDKKTLRTLDLRMTAAAHFMHHRYSGFNAPIKIKPPG